MRPEVSEVARLVARLRELGVERAATWFDDWGHAAAFDVRFREGPREIGEELEQALTALTANAVPAVLPTDATYGATEHGDLVVDEDEGIWIDSDVNGRLVVDVESATVAIAFSRSTWAPGEQHFEIDLRDVQGWFEHLAGIEPEEAEPPPDEGTDWHARWHVTDRLDEAGEIARASSVLAEHGASPRFIDELAAVIAGSGGDGEDIQDDDDDDDDDFDVDPRLVGELLAAAMTWFRNVGIERASVVYEQIKDEWSIDFDAEDPPPVPRGERTPETILAELDEPAQAFLDDLFEYSEWGYSELATGEREVHRDDDLGKALTTVATLILEALVDWNDFGEYDAPSGSFELDVAGNRAAVDWRALTLQRMEPVRVELPSA